MGLITCLHMQVPLIFFSFFFLLNISIKAYIYDSYNKLSLLVSN